MPTHPVSLDDHTKAARLLARYAHGVDGGGAEEVLACVTDDVVFEYESGAIRLEGPDEIRAFLLTKLIGVSTHLISNVVVSDEGECKLVKASAIVCVTREEGTVHMRGIQYEVLCADADDEFRIACLRHRALWQFAAPNEFQGPPPLATQSGGV